MLTRLPYYSKIIAASSRISPTVLICTSLFLLSCFSLASSSMFGRPSSSQSADWDLLIFTQNWPKSVCIKWSSKGKNNTCYTYPNNTWTVHGLWPTKLGTIGPAFCDKSKSFNPEAIYGIEDQLMQIWTPVEHHKNKYAFWSHEWTKHGTCASVLPQVSTEFDYFYKAIELNNQYNMNKVLQQAGISPGQIYNVTQIWDGVKNILRKRPQVVCYQSQEEQVLLEIRICLDKQFNLVDCNGTVVGSGSNSGYQNLTNCPIQNPVRFPDGTLGGATERPNPQQPESPLLEKLKILRLTQFLTG